MKTTFLLFFTLFFSVYILLNFYVIKRSIQLMSPASIFRIPVLILMISFSVSFILGHFFSRTSLLTLAEPLEFIGSLWIGAAFYLFLIYAAIDGAKVVARISSINPGNLLSTIDHISKMCVPIAISLILIYGFVNSRIIRTTKIGIQINKKVPADKKNLKIVMLSDIHLGVMMDNCRFAKIVKKVNALSPDIILLAGDILDQDVSQVTRKDLGASLLKLNASMGVYACTGNHEYIGGIENAIDYLQKHNIILLQDTMLKVGEFLQLAGRKDKSSGRFSGNERKVLTEIINGHDKSMPLILLDHQPSDLNAAQECGVDLQLSGHTHHGQIWPANLITGRLFENDYGYTRKGTTHYYVSSGAGTWGPPLRIGSVSEIVVIDIEFK